MVMSLNKQAYIKKFRDLYQLGLISNNSVLRLVTPPPPLVPSYRIIGIHKLTPQENAGNHNLYIDVLDKDGNRANEKIKWGWLGQKPNEKPNPVTLDKPDNEPAGNIVIWGNQIIWAEVLNKPSDGVVNVNTQLADEGPGNTYGHFSYYVVWMWVENNTEPEPTPDPDDCKPIQEKLDKANKQLDDIRKILNGAQRCLD